MRERFRQISIKSLLVLTAVASAFVWWTCGVVEAPKDPSDFHFIDSSAALIEMETTGGMYCFGEPCKTVDGSVMRILLRSDSGPYPAMVGLMLQLPSKVAADNEFLLKPVTRDLVDVYQSSLKKMPLGYFGGFMTAHQVPATTIDGAKQTGYVKLKIISVSKTLVRAKFLFVLDFGEKSIRIERTASFKRKHATSGQEMP